MEEDDEFAEQLAFLARHTDNFDGDYLSDEGGYGNFEDAMYGQGDEIDVDRPATFKEQQAVGFGELGAGKGVFNKRIGRTLEDIASEKIRMELEGGNYSFLNTNAKKSVRNRLLDYKNFTMANVPAMVAAGAWIEQNSSKKEPTNTKKFEKFCKNIGSDVSPLDIFRYIRSLKSFEKK